MTFKERNQIIGSLITRYKELHDLYTVNSKQLTDYEWECYINSMEAITKEQEGTSLRDVAGELQMAFLNDTEYMQKRLRKHEMQAQ